MNDKVISTERYNELLVAEAKLKRIADLKLTRESGRARCTYSDTDFDSLSVVYGYNIALDDMEGEIKRILTSNP